LLHLTHPEKKKKPKKSKTQKEYEKRCRIRQL